MSFRTLLSSICIAAVVLSGCAAPSRMGMVKDSRTGIQIGSEIERSIFLDSSQFRNKSIKLSIRNTSGDQAYRIREFTNNLEGAFAQKGYVPTQADSFGIKFDVNVLYSGQIQRSLESQFAFLGGAAGGIAGSRSTATSGTAAGLLVGATLGAIVGSNVTDDTYIVISEVSIGVARDKQGGSEEKKVISFGSSPALQEDGSGSSYVPFQQVIRTRVAVFAGGRNVSQAEIAELVRRRLVDIIADSI